VFQQDPDVNVIKPLKMPMTHKYTDLLNQVQNVQNSKAKSLNSNYKMDNYKMDSYKIESYKTDELPEIGNDKRLSSQFEDVTLRFKSNEVPEIKNKTNEMSNRVINKVSKERKTNPKIENESFENLYNEVSGQSSFPYQYAERPKTRMGRTQGTFRMSRKKKCRRKLQG
jgi:hypothetical protein